MNIHDLLKELREPNESKIVLVVADGVMLSGSECPNCRYLQQGTAPNCSKCGRPWR